MPLETILIPYIDRRAWSELQRVVRSYRAALRRGEQPEIAAFAPAGCAERRIVLAELIHEDLEFRLKAGEAANLEAYLERFPELAEDAQILTELAAAGAMVRGCEPAAGADPVRG